MPPQSTADEALRAAASFANSEVYRQATSGDPKTEKMGATCVLVLLQGGRRAVVAHLGDSRAYLLRNHHLVQLTRDHTVVQRMLERNMLTEEEARHHPDANVVTRAFGQKPEIELDVSAPVDLYDGDRLLLCSDGLCGYVEDAAIQQTLDAGGDAQAATERLVALALQAGGEDNVSVQVIALEQPASAVAAVGPARRPASARAARPSSWSKIAPIVLAAFVMGALLPWYWMHRKENSNGQVSKTPQTPGVQDRQEAEISENLPSTPPASTSRRPPPIQRPAQESPAASPDEVTTPPPEAFSLSIIGEPGELFRVLSGYGEMHRIPPAMARDQGLTFPRGHIYFRPMTKYQQEAEKIRDKLNDLNSTRQRNGIYDIQPWPSIADHEETLRGTDLLVVEWTMEENDRRVTVKSEKLPLAEDRASESLKQGTVPEETPVPTQAPILSPAVKPPVPAPPAASSPKGRWKTLFQEGTTPEAIPKRLLKVHPEIPWPPQASARVKKVLQPGIVYYQGRNFMDVAVDVAGELQYETKIMPIDVWKDLKRTDILIVFKSLPKNDRSRR